MLYLIFLLADYEAIKGRWALSIPEKHRDKIVHIVDDVKKGMKTYFVAQSQVVLLVSILFAIGFKIIGMPMAIAMGVFVGLLNYVPYLQLIGIIPTLYCYVLGCLL